jgi:cell division septation protein DedD
VIGAIIIVAIIVIALPMAFCATGAALSAIMGWVLWDDAEKAHEGSELVDLNV